MMPDKIIDTCKVWVVTLLSYLTFVNINGFLTTISLVLAISYTLWKWRKNIKRNENS